MVDVFISYPRVSRERAERLRQGLEAKGLTVFFDVDGIDGGAEFPIVIDKAVKSAQAVLGCWSPIAFTRSWVLQECRVGRARGVLVPVAIEPFDSMEVPTEFFGINYFDLSDWTGQADHPGWRLALRSIGRLVGRDLLAPTPEAPRAPPAVAGVAEPSSGAGAAPSDTRELELERARSGRNLAAAALVASAVFSIVLLAVSAQSGPSQQLAQLIFAGFVATLASVVMLVVTARRHRALRERR
ncbi:MAG TPA: toll/interleukin-1 receptor domain-containing protein [Caulobacteraceae bacterium]|nr:toll/interleukin-1 receptor domain-containing protein [Caulobacteraceae bacterium]